jgi:hypothetical protein
MSATARPFEDAALSVGTAAGRSSSEEGIPAIWNVCVYDEDARGVAAADSTSGSNTNESRTDWAAEIAAVCV